MDCIFPGCDALLQSSFDVVPWGNWPTKTWDQKVSGGWGWSSKKTANSQCLFWICVCGRFFFTEHNPVFVGWGRVSFWVSITMFFVWSLRDINLKQIFWHLAEILQHQRDLSSPRSTDHLDWAGHYFQLSVVVIGMLRQERAESTKPQPFSIHFNTKVRKIRLHPVGEADLMWVIIDFHIHLVVGPSNPISWRWLLMKHLKPQSRGV